MASAVRATIDIFAQHQLRSFVARLEIDARKGAPDEVKTQAAGSPRIEGTADKLRWFAWRSEIAQSKDDLIPGQLADEVNRMIGCVTVRVADDVGAGLIETENDQVLLAGRQRNGSEKSADEFAHEAEVPRMAGKFEFAFHYNPSTRMVRSSCGGASCR